MLLPGWGRSPGYWGEQELGGCVCIGWPCLGRVWVPWLWEHGECCVPRRGGLMETQTPKEGLNPTPNSTEIPTCRAGTAHPRGQTLVTRSLANHSP